MDRIVGRVEPRPAAAAALRRRTARARPRLRRRRARPVAARRRRRRPRRAVDDASSATRERRPGSRSTRATWTSSASTRGPPRPMRALLRRRPEHDEIQPLARRAGSRRAGQPPRARQRAGCGGGVPPVPVRGAGRGAPTGAAQLAAARGERRPERRRALAAEVLGPDYVGGDGPLGGATGGRSSGRDAAARALGARVGERAARARGRPSGARRSGWRPSGARGPRAPAAERPALAGGRRGAAGARARRDRAGPGRSRRAAKHEMQRGAARPHRTRRTGSGCGSPTPTLASQRGLADAAAQFKRALALAERGPPSRRRPRRGAAAPRGASSRARPAHRAARTLPAAPRRTRTARQAVEVELLRPQLALCARRPVGGARAARRIDCDEPEIVARVATPARPRAAGRRAHRATRSPRPRTPARGCGGRCCSSAATASRRSPGRRGPRAARQGARRPARRGGGDARPRLGRRRAGAGSAPAEAVCRCSVRIAALQLRGMGDLNAGVEVHLDQARRTDTARGGDAWTPLHAAGRRAAGAAARGRRPAAGAWSTTSSPSCAAARARRAR